MLPAGALRVNPHQLLSGSKWSSLLDQLRARYRYIIVDTPPALVASESFVLTRGADATLISTMNGVSRMASVSDVYAQLLQAGAHPVGVVLSGVRSGSYYRYRDTDYNYVRKSTSPSST